MSDKLVQVGVVGEGGHLDINCLIFLLWNYRFSLPASPQDLGWSFSPIYHTKEQSRDMINMEQKSEITKKYIFDSVNSSCHYLIPQVSIF